MIRIWSARFLALLLAVAVLLMFISRPWIDPTLFQCGLFLLGCFWAVALTVRPFDLRFSFPMIPLACAAAWGLLEIRAGWTASIAETRAAVLVWLGNLTAFVLAAQICDSARARRQLLDALVYFAFALSVVSVLQYFSGATKIFWLFSAADAPVLGPFVNRDQFAAYIEMVLPLALVQALGSDARSISFAAISAAMYASVIAGASRAGALLVTAEVAIVPLALWLRRRPGPAAKRNAALPVWLLAIVFAAVVGWAVLWGRFQDPDPLAGRREILRDTVAMIHAKPLTGFGLGTFRTVYSAYASLDFGAIVHHAHNDWAEWAADGGIPFSLFVLSIAVWAVPRALRSVWGIGILAVFVHGAVDFPLQKPVLELWLFVLLGALSAEATASPN